MKEVENLDQVIDFHSKDLIGHILVPFMKSNPELNTTELAHTLGVTQSLISKIRTNKATFHFDDLPNLFNSVEGCVGVDEFKIEMLHQFTNGFVPPLPDYQNVSTDLTSLSSRVMEEMQQSIAALHDALDEFSDPSSSTTLDNIQDPEQAFKQLYDVVRYALALMAIITNNYQLGWTDVAQQREAEIKQSHEHMI